MALSGADIPQANDPERVLRLARHLAGAPKAELPPEFAHPRDRHFYLQALHALGALGPDDQPTAALNFLATAADPRRTFSEIFSTSNVGAAWLAWAQTKHLSALDPAQAPAFLVACSSLSPSTAARRASTLRRWLAWCLEEAPPPAPKDETSPPPAMPPPATPPPSPRPDPHRLLAGLARAEAALHLDTLDICFLAALYLRGDRGALACFEDEVLIDVFEQVSELLEHGPESPRKRATHAIQRLRDGRLLQRVDGSGLVRAGEFTLTGLAAAIVDFYLRDEALTKESLVLLTRMLHLNLTEIRGKARKATGDEWRTFVAVPLGVTVRDLVDGIRRRQRGLDAQQEEVQAQIGALLHEKWLDALAACEQLLDTTTATLRELNEVLLRDTHLFITVLQEIQQLAGAAGAGVAEEASQRVLEQVDVIAAWGSARQRAWSEYYQYVHRFLQDVVRLDPSRAVSQRLRDLISGFSERPFSIFVAAEPSYRWLRPVEARVERTPVARERTGELRQILEVAAEDPRAWLEEQVVKALIQGAESLSEITQLILAQLPTEDHFVFAGRIAACVAELAAVNPGLEHPFQPVSERLEVGEWALEGLREAP